MYAIYPFCLSRLSVESLCCRNGRVITHERSDTLVTGVLTALCVRASISGGASGGASRRGCYAYGRPRNHLQTHITHVHDPIRGPRPEAKIYSNAPGGPGPGFINIVKEVDLKLCGAVVSLSRACWVGTNCKYGNARD